LRQTVLHFFRPSPHFVLVAGGSDGGKKSIEHVLHIPEAESPRLHARFLRSLIHDRSHQIVGQHG
jgi:hypothetical protein